MFEQVEETIKQGKELFAKKKPLKKPICPICGNELELYKTISSVNIEFYRCINLECQSVGLPRFLQGIKPNE